MILDSIQDYAIVLLDLEGRITSWNLGAERVHGWHADEVLGRSLSRFYTADDVAHGEPERELRGAAEQGRLEQEGWRVRKDGSVFWADVVITAVIGPDGRPSGFTAVTRDLTEQRRATEALRQSEERFRLLVDGVKDYAIFMLDPKGRVLTWNAGAERIKGWRAEEIIGQHFSRFYPPEDVQAGKCEQALAAAVRDGSWEDEGWRVRKDGSRFWSDVIITALHDRSGAIRGFAKVTRDLTERRAAEQERIRLAHIEEALRLRDEFLSVAAHELKTPLTALQLQLQNLRRRGGAEPGIEARISRATHSCERLGELVHELLEVSRIANGRFVLRRQLFALGEAVLDVVGRFQEQATLAGCPITVELGEEASGSWDRLRIEQVVGKLLSNAVKYGAGAPVRLSAGADGGPGIPPEALPRMFGRFERAAPIHHYGGLGLGLYVAREIVEAHGGSIRAENLPERGARFTVRLPLQDGVPARPSVPA